MACMEHVCPCGHMWFNNRGGGDCPECGNEDMSVRITLGSLEGWRMM